MTAVLPISAAVHPTSFHELTSTVSGRVLLPTDADYPALATPWNVAVTNSPLAVVEATSAEDVQAAVRFATQHKLQVAVQATGHGATHYSVPTILVHTRLLDEVTIDPRGSVRVGAGVRWETVINSVAPYGLSALAGSAPDTGVVGYLTGGGLSPIGRAYGFGSDLVTAFDVVTGDGEIRRATPTENTGLFWGLRGGKGALGIVTAVEFELLPFGEIIGGAMFFDGSSAAEVAHAWRTWAEDLPVEATTSLAFMRLPEMPMVPPPLAGRLTVAIRFAWTGEPAQAPDVAAVFADIAEPLLGGIGPMPFQAIGAIHADPVEPMPTAEWTAMTSTFGADLIDGLLALAGPQSHCPQIMVEIRRLGGAFAVAPGHSSAVSHRSAEANVFMVGLAIPPLADALGAHHAAADTTLAPWTVGRQPNFAADPATVARAYDSDSLARLGALVTTYDPDAVISAARSIREACLVRN